jgi:dUTP pyrophosphatase
MLPINISIIDNRIKHEHLTPKTFGSAGIDLHACLDEIIEIMPGERVLVPTGIAIHIADRGYAGFIFPRSGLAHREGLTVGNSVGVIDSDYQGQLMVSCWNSSGVKRYLGPMDRFAQLLIMPILHEIKFNFVSSFAKSERGEGGFGSTGV